MSDSLPAGEAAGEPSAPVAGTDHVVGRSFVREELYRNRREPETFFRMFAARDDHGTLWVPWSPDDWYLEKIWPVPANASDPAQDASPEGKEG